ncbi:MAG: Gfo/Idh/MocA family oxidoreductase [Opitutae bacterium]|nr:Gfo/Idh/MocA family oxidoreductase [Opitutae bacterium]
MKLRLSLIALFAFALLATLRAEPLKIAIVGLDSSHSVAFTKLLHEEKNPDHVPGGVVVAAFKGGSPDIEKSIKRIDGFTEQMSKLGVKIAGTIAETVAGVDAVLIVSVDGRAHLEQFKQVVALAPGKPVFIDKPLGGSLREGAEIFRLARKEKIPVFTASTLRFTPALQDLQVGTIRTAIGYSPAELEAHHPDLFWYNIHAVETVYRMLGRGCVSVSRVQTANSEVATGVWSDGRVGVVLGLRGTPGVYGFKVFGEKRTVGEDLKVGYGPLVRAVMTFFQTKQPPVTAAESLETLAFMEAADLSKKQGGKAVSLSELLAPYADIMAPTP